MIAEQLSRRAAALEAERVPFVQATVVRARRPASVRAGATALVLGDGTIEGFVGGHCAEPSVRLHALRVLETGEALLLRIEPGNGERRRRRRRRDRPQPVHQRRRTGDLPGAPRAAPRACTSSATRRSRTRSPSSARGLGYDVGRTRRRVRADERRRRRGRRLARPRRAATRWPPRSTSASRTSASWRAASAAQAVVAELEVSDDDRARVHTPAGLDIGARTPEEIALSILAEIVASPAAAARRPRRRPVTKAPEGHHCHE